MLLDSLHSARYIRAVNRCSLTLMLTAIAISAMAEPITTDQTNPHYLSFHGKPILLITSAEHYGAVINKAFDYVAYFDSLKANGLNYTRIYPGAMFEPMGKFMTGNTLAPKMNELIVPWARSTELGYLFGGNKFDLDHWDPQYFARLKDFIAQAAARGVFVEICFFNSQYSDTWPLSPLYFENNIQHMEEATWKEAQTLKHEDLVKRSDDYVRKIVQEVNPFENVVLETCDECADIGTGVDLAGPWVSHLADVVHETENSLPNKHLLAQEVEGHFGSRMDFSADPKINIIVAQYIWGPDAGEMGGLKGLDFKYRFNKPIEMNETYYYPLDYKDDKEDDSRVEAWEFIVGGGASFNQLNGLYTVKNPSGKTSADEKMWRALQSLQSFMAGLEYVKMKPDQKWIRSGASKAAYYRVLSEAGVQYALYVHHSGDRRAGGYQAIPGRYQERLHVELPAGSYQVEWIDPANGHLLASEQMRQTAGECVLKSPAYRIDMALRIIKR